MSDLIDISALAKLFLEEQKPFGKGSIGAASSYDKAFDYYLDHNENLVATFPDRQYRQWQLAKTVRAVVRRILNTEAGGVEPGSAEQLQIPSTRGWGMPSTVNDNDLS